MTKLEILEKTEELGGEERRKGLERLMIMGRDLGCSLEIGGGKVGGINFRYGSIRYAILDVNAEGEIKLYASPHPGKVASETLHTALNTCIEKSEGLEPRQFPIGTYGMLQSKIEEVPIESLEKFLETSIALIREEYYVVA
jgi:hypothetical protein